MDRDWAVDRVTVTERAEDGAVTWKTGTIGGSGGMGWDGVRCAAWTGQRWEIM